MSVFVGDEKFVCVQMLWTHIGTVERFTIDGLLGLSRLEIGVSFVPFSSSDTRKFREQVVDLPVSVPNKSLGSTY